MGRKKIEMHQIDDTRNRRVCFKKRRVGVLKKAMQLSKLCGVYVTLTIYSEEDNSLMLYQSEKTDYNFT